MFKIVAFKPVIMRDDWKPLREQVKKKTLENARQASVWLQRRVKNRARKDTSKKGDIPVEYQLFVWSRKRRTWQPLRKKPTEFMAGKRSVVESGGRGGRTRVKNVQDVGIRRWNKASKPGEGPRSHPTDVPGWSDHWLHGAIYWSKEDAEKGTIRVYVDEKLGGKHVQKVLRALEFGGSSTTTRKWVVGYYVGTIRNGYIAERGNGRTVEFMGRKNKSGKTRRTHKRTFKQPHVALSRRWVSQKWDFAISARPFMAPVQDAFFKEYFPELYKNLTGK